VVIASDHWERSNLSVASTIYFMHLYQMQKKDPSKKAHLPKQARRAASPPFPEGGGWEEGDSIAIEWPTGK
jgi:hypothetical protein